MVINKLDALLKFKREEMMKLVVVGSQDREVLQAIVQSSKLNIVEPILIGDEDLTRKIAKDEGLDISAYVLMDKKNIKEAAEIAVKMVSSGKADFLMKGLVTTGTLLKAVLNKDWGLRTGSLISHIMLYEVPTYSKLIYLTDGGINLEPNMEDKVQLIENAGVVGRALGRKEIKVAALAAKEQVDPNMISTVHGGELKALYDEGKFSKDIIVDGPMALDLAISKESAKIKGYKSVVSGEVDVLLVPNIEMGNGIGKSITYFADGKSAGIVMGAKSPIVLTSRADSHETKLFSIALGSFIASYLKNRKQN